MARHLPNSELSGHDIFILFRYIALPSNWTLACRVVVAPHKHVRLKVSGIFICLIILSFCLLGGKLYRGGL